MPRRRRTAPVRRHVTRAHAIAVVAVTCAALGATACSAGTSSRTPGSASTTAGATVTTAATPTTTTTTTAPAPAPPMRVVGYLPGWTNDNLAALDLTGVTDVNYAFAQPTPTGDCVLPNPAADTAKLTKLVARKAANPGLHINLALGGASGAEKFSAMAATDTGRRHFADACVALVTRLGLDGLDLDWEFPAGGGTSTGTPADIPNATALARELRRALDTAGPGRPLTAAVPVQLAWLAHFELAPLAGILDAFNLMAYDVTPLASPTTGHNAPLAAAPGAPVPPGAGTGPGQDGPPNADQTINQILAAGVPAAKIHLGLPFYGRGWTGTAATDNGRFQPHGKGITSKSYAELVRSYLPKGQRFYDPVAKVPYSYAAADGTWITYDDAESLSGKVAYARSRNLGGVMIWTLTGDDAAHTLLHAITIAARPGT